MVSIKVNKIGHQSLGIGGVSSTIKMNETPTLPPGNEVDLYILCGQSNVGRARLSEMTAGEVAKYGGLIPSTKIFNPYISTSVVNDLDVGSNTMLADADNLDEFGCEASLLRSLPLSRKYLLKYGDGATSMQAFWSACANRTGWQNLLTYTTNIVNIIVADSKIPILRAFIFMQGEGDAGSQSFADNYEWRLQCFFDEFKTFWNNILTTNSWSTQDYKVIIGRINSPTSTYRDTVRTAQQNFCAISANNAEIIDTDSYPLKDIVHYSATGQVQFGIDIYKVLTQ